MHQATKRPAPAPFVLRKIQRGAEGPLQCAEGSDPVSAPSHEYIVSIAFKHLLHN